MGWVFLGGFTQKNPVGFLATCSGVGTLVVLNEHHQAYNKTKYSTQSNQ